MTLVWNTLKKLAFVGLSSVFLLFSNTTLASPRIGVAVGTFDPPLLSDFFRLQKKASEKDIETLYLIVDQKKPKEIKLNSQKLRHQLLELAVTDPLVQGKAKWVVLAPQTEVLSNQADWVEWVKTKATVPGASSLDLEVIDLSQAVTTPAELAKLNFYENCLTEEAKLPKPVAKEIKKQNLYGRGLERGFYDLPEALIAQLNYEQLANDRIEDISQFSSINQSNDLNPKYLPENRPVFYLPHVELPKDQWLTYQTLSSELALQGSLLTDQGYRFFTHPESVAFFNGVLANPNWKYEFLATPTSSHRSLIVWNPNTNDPPFGIKTSLDVEIGEVSRLLSKGQIDRATVTSALVKTLSEVELAKNGIHFIDEPFSLVPLSSRYGMTLREVPLSRNGNLVVPLFSLYSKSPTGGAPLIIELIGKSGLTPKEFIAKQIIQPLISQTIYLGLNHGLVGIHHEQNVMAELETNRLTGQLYYRDFGGYVIDPSLRKAANKDMHFYDPNTLIHRPSLRLESADLIEHLDTYLRGSNFYAAQKALAPYFPEITRKWMDSIYNQILKSEFSQALETPIRNKLDLNQALKSWLIKDKSKIRKTRTSDSQKNCPFTVVSQMLNGP